jgi:heme-degrading monooxygenase HmoA
MVSIVTNVRLQEGRERDWDAVMRERMAAAAKQPGWIGGQLLEPDAGSRRTIVGTWRTRDDWQRWHEDPAFTKTRQELDRLTTEPEQHTWYRVVVDVRPT